MSAREKLNSAYVVGVVVLAGLCGLIADSGPVFFITAGAIFIVSLQSGRIRL
jgi:hypothetical protein